MLETDRIIKKGLRLLPENYFTRSRVSNASLTKANIKFKRSASQSNIILLNKIYSSNVQRNLRIERQKRVVETLDEKFA